MAQQKFLTKSRFKIGWECPRKLFYLDREEYPSTKNNDPFLKALAEGGFQVGALAKAYYPTGIEIREKNTQKAATQTMGILNSSNSCVIFEAAIAVPPFAARLDVLEKQGKVLKLIEVKAKSWEPGEPFFTKGSKKTPPTPNSKWAPYLIDTAFQTWLLRQVFPDYQVEPYLGLMDKTKFTCTDGLHQKFRVRRDGDVITSPLTSEELACRLLSEVPISREVDLILAAQFSSKPFDEYAQWLATLYQQRSVTTPEPSTTCKDCEFRNESADPNGKDGFVECWTSITGESADGLANRPLAFNLWNYRGAEKMFANGKYFLDDIDEREFEEKNDQREELTRKQRQLLQIHKIKTRDTTSWINRVSISKIFESLKYPLHFIDFETTRVAIPFHRSMRTYSQLAFQFSEHLITQDGSIKHASEFINRAPGAFPNFEFARALKHRLEKDEGTVLMYYPHEERVLRDLRTQLLVSREPDKQELVSFIETLTRPPSEGEQIWNPSRPLLDMWDMVVKYYFHPSTNGSNSIKDVLPAVISESTFLQNKYSQPIYGANDGIPSHNFTDMTWIRHCDGRVMDPYRILNEPLMNDIDLTGVEPLFEDQEIAEGGAAMIAYARMQFTEMGDQERETIIKKLLRYCELDTFAMVMLFEHWKSIL